MPNIHVLKCAVGSSPRDGRHGTAGRGAVRDLLRDRVQTCALTSGRSGLCSWVTCIGLLHSELRALKGMLVPDEQPRLGRMPTAVGQK